MSAAVSYERVRDQLATLGLEAALTSLDPVLARGPQDAKVAVDVLDEPLGLELATLRFLHQGENVLLLGPCGVGKTHFATGRALTARNRPQLGRFMQTRLRPALLHPHQQHELLAVRRDLPRHRARHGAPRPAAASRHDDHQPRGTLPPPSTGRTRRPTPPRGRHPPRRVTCPLLTR